MCLEHPLSKNHLEFSLAFKTVSTRKLLTSFFFLIQVGFRDFEDVVLGTNLEGNLDDFLSDNWILYGQLGTKCPL